MTASFPRVSIGLPVYNGERYVHEAIESVLAQTFNDFELVISDNASSDGTEDICRGYARRDSRVRYHRNAENVGGSRNFTCAFELSRAPYFKWAAHDDLCAPAFLQKSVAVLDGHPGVVLCYPRSAFIDQNGVVIGDHEAASNLRSPRPSTRAYQFLAEAHTHCFPMFGLIRRKALERTSLVAPYISSDQILLLQLALMGEFRELPERLFFFREHPERSVWQFKTLAGMASWYDPKRTSSFQFPRWRLVREFICSITAADLPAGEAAACFLSVMKWCSWHREPLLRDVAMALRQIAARVTGSAPIEDKLGAPPVRGAGGFQGAPVPGKGDITA